MYIRTTTQTNKDGSKRTYLQLVEGARVNGQSRQRTIATLGRLDKLLSSQALPKLAEQLQTLAGTPSVARLRDIRVGTARSCGIVEVVRHLWKRAGYDQAVRDAMRGGRYEAPLGEAILAMVTNRLDDPKSKLGMMTWLDTVYAPGWEELSLHHLYRGIDVLAEIQGRMDAALWRRYERIVGNTPEMVFFDTTSSYFERHPVGDLAQRGFSKDHRPDLLQIVLGLTLTAEGIPLTHQVFAGNTSDHTAIEESMQEVKHRYGMKRLVVVGDRGMMAGEFLSWVEESGWEYIIGQPLRRWKAPEALLAHFAKKKEKWHVSGGILEEKLPSGERLILCYNPERAEYDAGIRQELREQLEQAIASGSVRSLLKGYHRFLTTEGTVAINEQAFTDDAIFDGIWIVRTNTALPKEEVIASSKQAWMIERQFRTLKSSLELRPMFHWTERRIRGHVAMCVYALTLRALLQHMATKEELDASVQELLDDCRSVQVIPVSMGTHTMLQRSNPHERAASVYRLLGLNTA